MDEKQRQPLDFTTGKILCLCGLDDFPINCRVVLEEKEDKGLCLTFTGECSDCGSIFNIPIRVINPTDIWKGG